MIWDVKIFLAKIKDCKGKDYKLFKQEKIADKNPAKNTVKNTLF